jgi:phosphatidylglycerophosphate synthase
VFLKLLGADDMKRRRAWWLAPSTMIWFQVSALAVLLTPLVWHDFGTLASLRFAALLAITGILLPRILVSLRQRVGPEPNTIANALTLARLAVGCALAALVLSGAHDRLRAAAVFIWALVVIAATLGDWLDGPIARREGMTKFGGMLDIESDSWLTLWSALAAVTLGDLPWICLLAPLLRYLHPLLDLSAGKVPAGGGPWWSRVTGVAQMAMLISGFAPVEGALRDAVLGALIWPVSLAQVFTMLALLALRRR